MSTRLHLSPPIYYKNMAANPPSSMEYILSPATFLFFGTTLLSYYVVTPRFGHSLLPFYRHLTQDKQQYFSTLPSSTLNAVVATAFSAAALFQTPWTPQTLSHCESPYGFFVMQAVMGYFAADFIVVAGNRYTQKDVGMLLHHLAGLVSILVCCYYHGQWMMYVLMRLGSELSTPFYNLVWLVSETSCSKSSLMYIIAGAGMVVTFFLSRILTLPLLYYTYFNMVLFEMESTALYAFSMDIKVIGFVLGLILDILNLYWACKILGEVRMTLTKQKCLIHSSID